MYEVVKVLNNNTILAHRDNEEVIVMYKGIGFGKKASSEKVFNAEELSNKKQYL